MRRILMVICLLLVLASCGNGELTLTEYAEQVEHHTTTMYARLEAATEEGAFASATVEKIQSIYGVVAEAYGGLLEGLEAIEPPSDVAELHDIAVESASRLKAAGDAMARRANAVETPDQLDALFESPEARALEVASLEMTGFCQERQSELDATAERDVFADTPWIPAELQEVVLVAFGCDTQGD